MRATPNLAVEVTLRKLPRGELSFPSSGDHIISVHASAPARMSCHGGTVASLATRGEIFILPSGASDQCTQDDPSEVVDLRLPAALVRRAAEEMGLGPEVGPALECGVRDIQIEHMAWALEAEHRSHFPGGQLYRECLGLALAVQLLSRHRSPITSRAPPGLNGRQLQLVVDCIEADLAGDLSLVRLARVAGTSASHFRVLFKRSMGVPVHEYVVQRRVAHAQAMLRAGRLPASAIAFEVGFAHQSHMARCMRRVLGVTPKDLAHSERAAERPSESAGRTT